MFCLRDTPKAMFMQKMTMVHGDHGIVGRQTNPCDLSCFFFGVGTGQFGVTVFHMTLTMPPAEPIHATFSVCSKWATEIFRRVVVQPLIDAGKNSLQGAYRS